MERITITDVDDLEAFIEGQMDARKYACAVFIASRAALRSAPYAINFLEFHKAASDHNLSSLATWRCLMTAGVAGNIPSPNIRNAAAASVAASSVDASASAAADAASRADGATGNAIFASADVWAKVSTTAQLWLEHADQLDGKLSIDVAPLWTDENPLEQKWLDLRERLFLADTVSERGADWSFWIKWYDDILAGNTQNWDMLHEIATTPDIDWEASSREVNDKINGIVARYHLDEVIKNHALDRKVVFNAQTNRLASEDIEARDLEDIVKSLRTALRRFVSRVAQDHAGNRMGAYVHAACELWIKRFRKEISKAKDSTSDLAHCVHMNLIELQKIIEIEAFQRDLDVNRLLSELEVIEQQIMVAAPEVLALRKDQNKVKIELYEDKYLLEAKRMTHGMMLDCEGPLEAVMAWVLYTLHDKFASDAQNKAAIGFARGALPRGARELMMNDMDGSDPSKDTSLLKRMGEVGDALYKTDKGLDALQEFATEGQELITEGGPWVTEFLSKLSIWL